MIAWHIWCFTAGWSVGTLCGVCRYGVSSVGMLDLFMLMIFIITGLGLILKGIGGLS